MACASVVTLRARVFASVSMSSKARLPARSKPQLRPGAISTSWTFDVDLADGTYRIIAKADDAAANVEPAIRRTFSVEAVGPDTLAPTSTVAVPAADNDVITQAAVVLSGTSTDDVGVELASLVIRTCTPFGQSS